MSNPAISIITATYNASHLLKYAIASVLNSDFKDWELLVIGDHCTDDSESLVLSFNDQRIHFTNLPSNSGQQAKPNNVGIQQARGKYLCFLNQDDMFLPWHLSSMIETLQKSEADIVCAQYAIIAPTARVDGTPKLRATNGGASQLQPDFIPSRWHVASSWFMPLAVAEQVGLWKMESDAFVSPSQEWIFRAWKSGKRIFCAQSLSLVTLPSLRRKDIYRTKCSWEHQFVYEQLVATPHQLSNIKASIEQSEAAALRSTKRKLQGLYNTTIGRLLVALGIHPSTAVMIIRFGGRGGFVRNWQRLTSSTVSSFGG